MGYTGIKIKNASKIQEAIHFECFTDYINSNGLLVSFDSDYLFSDLGNCEGEAIGLYSCGGKIYGYVVLWNYHVDTQELFYKTLSHTEYPFHSLVMPLDMLRKITEFPNDYSKEWAIAQYANYGVDKSLSDF